MTNLKFVFKKVRLQNKKKCIELRSKTYTYSSKNWNPLWKVQTQQLHSKLCKLLFFIAGKETVLQNPSVKIIIGSVHFVFNLNLKINKHKERKKASTTIQRTQNILISERHMIHIHWWMTSIPSHENDLILLINLLIIDESSILKFIKGKNYNHPGSVC